MNSIAEDIKDYFEESAVGLVLGTDLFVGEMPPTPDRCVCLSETAGVAPMLQYEWAYARLQILVRSTLGGYNDAYDLAKVLSDAIHGMANEEINSTVYKLIAAVGEPAYLGRDQNGRPMFSVNLDVQRTSA